MNELNPTLEVVGTIKTRVLSPNHVTSWRCGIVARIDKGKAKFLEYEVSYQIPKRGEVYSIGLATLTPFLDDEFDLPIMSTIGMKKNLQEVNDFWKAQDLRPQDST